MDMLRKWILCFFLCASFLMIGCGKNENSPEEKETLSETGTSMGGARAIRSAKLSVSGAIEGRWEAPNNDRTYLLGNCDPEVFANFSIHFSPPGYVWISVTLLGDAIQPGQTGLVPLSWVSVDFVEEGEEKDPLFFKGPGTFEITLHNASPENRRMQGIIKATGLQTYMGAEEQAIDAEFEFDMDFSCGVL